MRAPAREWQRLGCAAFLGAIIAFPTAMLFSHLRSLRSDAPDSTVSASPGLHSTEVRNPYAPNILSDPHVLQRHREMVEALEAYCRKTGKDCLEAKEARRYLDEREAAHGG